MLSRGESIICTGRKVIATCGTFDAHCQPLSPLARAQRDARPITKTKAKNGVKKLKVVMRLVQICAARSCRGVSSINNAATKRTQPTTRRRGRCLLSMQNVHTKSRVRDLRICWPFSQVILADNRAGCLACATRFVLRIETEKENEMSENALTFLHQRHSQLMWEEHQLNLYIISNNILFYHTSMQELQNVAGSIK